MNTRSMNNICNDRWCAMEPTKIAPYTDTNERQHWYARALNAIFNEHRLPGSVAKKIDKILFATGFKTKTSKIFNFGITYRRGTSDEAFIKNVLINEEYFAHNFYPKQNDTIVDIGANIGCFTLAVSRYNQGGRIIAVEPFPSNFDLLQRNINQNRIENVVLIPAAISSRADSTTLFVGNDTGMHSLVFDRGKGSIKVPALRFDSILHLLPEGKCNFLKIDCEGAEFDFLPTITSCAWSRIDKLVMEFSAPIVDWNQSCPTQKHILLKRQYGDELIRLLESNNFAIDAYLDCVGFRAGFIFAHNTYNN